MQDEDPTDKLAELLAAVYGPDEAGARDELVQGALRRLEQTHRQAALALRSFESSGTVENPGAPGGATPARRRKGTPAPTPEASSPSAPSTPAAPQAAAPAAQAPAQAPEAKRPARPKLPPPRVQRVSLTHSRDPLEIHSGVGQSIDFD